MTEQPPLVSESLACDVVPFPAFYWRLAREIDDRAIRQALANLPRGDCAVTADIPTSWVDLAQRLLAAGFYLLGCELQLGLSLAALADDSTDLAIRLADRADGEQLLDRCAAWQRRLPIHRDLPISPGASARHWWDQAFSANRRVFVTADDQGRCADWISTVETGETIQCDAFGGAAPSDDLPRAALWKAVLRRAKRRGFVRAQLGLELGRQRELNGAVELGFRVEGARMWYRWSRQQPVA